MVNKAGWDRLFRVARGVVDPEPDQRQDPLSYNPRPRSTVWA